MFKKLACSILSVIIASTAGIYACADSIKGDIDGSGKIDIEDVANVMNHINGVKSLSDEGIAAADLNSDGGVDIEDVVVMINEINGISSTAKEDGGSTYSNDLFSISADSNWKFIENKEYGNVSFLYVNDDITNACGVADVTVECEYIPGTDRYTMKELGDILLKDLKLGDATSFEPAVVATVNDYEAYIAEGTDSLSGKDYFIHAYVLRHNENIAMILASAYTDTGSEIDSRFNDVISTFRFK